MSQTLDLNLLLYASNSEAPEHERAAALIDHLLAGPALVVLFWPTLMGYLRVATHPSIFATPLSPAVAMGNVDTLLSRPHVRAVGENGDHWDQYRRVADEVAPRGNLVPDAHLVALMHQHGLRRIWSRDRDLRRFDGVTVVDPFADRYRDGFAS